MKERVKGYLEYKLDLELCGVNTFEKDKEVRRKYERYLQDKQQANNTIPTRNTNETTKTNDSSNLLEHKKREDKG